jgi:hypothetical protein
MATTAADPVSVDTMSSSIQRARSPPTMQPLQVLWRGLEAPVRRYGSARRYCLNISRW